MQISPDWLRKINDKDFLHHPDGEVDKREDLDAAEQQPQVEADGWAPRPLTDRAEELDPENSGQEVLNSIA